jgi:hypothetical protein
MPPTKRIARRPIEDDDDQVESPAEAPKTRPQQASNAALRAGWTGSQQVMDSTSSWAQAFIPEEKAMVIKFLDDEPYVGYRRHWVERTTQAGKSNRSYTCLQSFNEDCPLCEAGDKAQAVSSFNVAVIGDDGVPSLKSWDVGPKIFNILKGYANDPKIAPLTRGYFLVSKTGKKGSVNHNVTPIKASALEEDYDITPPEHDELDRVGKYDRDIIDHPTAKSLREIAAEFADDYE